MQRNSKTKKVLFWAGFLFLSFFIYKVFFTAPSNKNLDFNDIPKNITLNDNGAIFPIKSSKKTTSEILQDAQIFLDKHDEITPSLDSMLYSGMKIKINRTIKVKILVDGQKIENLSTAKTISNILDENKIILGRLDKVSPDATFGPQAGTDIIVTRINIEEKIIPTDINFKTIAKEDSKLGWREEKIEQKGEKGILETKYKITYKDNEEVSRVILEKNITREPINQIVTKGTYMQLSKPARGQGTWYSFQGGLFAASTSIPKGAFAKVTNLANNKSVVVQINDYGPFGKRRIIDLDKVAFAKIASLGAGVVGVKVEQILN